jgi:hypothetical protein
MSAATPHSDAASSPRPLAPETARIWQRRFAPLAIHGPALFIAVLAFWLTDDPVLILLAGGLTIFPTYLAPRLDRGPAAPPLRISPLSFISSGIRCRSALGALYGEPHR